MSGARFGKHQLRKCLGLSGGDGGTDMVFCAIQNYVLSPKRMF